MDVDCQAILTLAGKVIEAGPPARISQVRTPEGITCGRQITIDATEKDGLLNICRLTVLDPAVAPNGEAVRLEYEHDKQGKFGLRQVYSIQSLRQLSGKLVLMENFLAESVSQVREADFRPVQSREYTDTVLTSLQDWAKYRAWQIQEGK